MFSYSYEKDLTFNSLPHLQNIFWLQLRGRFNIYIIPTPSKDVFLQWWERLNIHFISTPPKHLWLQSRERQHQLHYSFEGRIHFTLTSTPPKFYFNNEEEKTFTSLPHISNIFHYSNEEKNNFPFSDFNTSQIYFIKVMRENLTYEFTSTSPQKNSTSLKIRCAF